MQQRISHFVSDDALRAYAEQEEKKLTAIINEWSAAVERGAPPSVGDIEMMVKRLVEFELHPEATAMSEIGVRIRNREERRGSQLLDFVICQDDLGWHASWTPPMEVAESILGMPCSEEVSVPDSAELIASFRALTDSARRLQYQVNGPPPFV